MRVFGCLVAVFWLAGCASTDDHSIQANDPFYAPVVPDMPKETIVENGGLFNVSMVNSLYSDVKARRIGDIITVNLRENTNASKSANTTTSRETAVDLQPIIGLGGQAVNIGNQSVQLGVDSSNEFTGDAQANQSNSLNGNISVTVIEVLPNQNLVIRGEKWLTLNNGNEYIRLTGIIRAADISPTNEIDSTKIANARIQYSGTGTFATAQKQGWLSRFFSSDWWPL
ncbi:flagellar basal body L-ring protein FlgH [Alteromonas sp. ASW11-36]|uniref:Flagellar L-ring protein n=1 Tax=Alteromonas arenosi TaxID=3055817 RepID=A0ABT7SVE6_9ALTE|nr:flagellar basal body L-ring protein FlgH [Alteromonas sp. ASW11-36]MDM7860168.1 flagellar basal body L-ring protein FlgH [Alteromonas sp. ASW11-36]